ncbi:MAG: sugar transferase [Thermodesulfobacteriota bacterium]|nr:sugar transferase [Thermodesulfobacteriota bacterium]
MKNHFKLSMQQKKRLLVAGDTLMVLAAFSLAYVFRISVYEGGSLSTFFPRVSWLMPIAAFLHIMAFYIFGLYDVEIRKSETGLFLWLIFSVSVATFFIVLVSYAFPAERMGRVLISVHVPVLIITVFFWRKFFFLLIQKEHFKKNLIMLDSHSLNLNTKTMDQLREGLKADYNWVGVVSGYKENPGTVMLNGTAEFPSLEALVAEEDIKAIVLSDNPKKDSGLRDRLIDFKFRGIDIFDFPTLHQLVLNKVPVLSIRGSYFLFTHQNRSFQPFIYLRLRRVIDVALASIGLVLSGPFFLVVAVAVKCSSKGPIFFRQERLGLNEEPFTLIKFRSMIEDAEKYSGPTWTSEGDPRITNVGKFLRKTRLDEIPQLFNVLKGEMSLVGPRPIRKHFTDQFTQYLPLYRLKFAAKPGLTGWAQVRGKHGSDVEGHLDNLQYELFYIQNRSFFLDLFILLKTIRTVLFGRGE